jgi:hypothetical protein
MDRKYNKAEILIQIPYDRYVTPDEQQVIRYHIPTNALSYFIFFHECFHLIDALSHMRRNKEKDLITNQAALKRAARTSLNYRKLHVEQCADYFAFRQYLDLCKRTG